MRDPDVIQREIERTRTELAESIDAIADRVSPRRAAQRGVASVKAQVSALTAHHDESTGTPPAPTTVRALPAGAGSQRPPARLRTDRVLLAVGAVAAVAAAVVIARR